jgi:ankyrin repeat protein
VVKFLLLKKVRVDVSDGSGNTALIHAARNGDIEVAGLLLQAGASIDAESFAGETALMHAVAADQSNMVHFLLESGASAQAKNVSGKTSVDLARTRGNRKVLDVIAPEFSFASPKLAPGKVRDGTLAFVKQRKAFEARVAKIKAR